MKTTLTTITVPVSVVQSTPDVQQLAGLANACGSQGVVKGEDVIYTVFNHLLPASLAGLINVLAPYGVQMTGYDADVYGSHYRNLRYLAVSDLSSELPSSIPSSTVTGEDESTRQLTWQEIQDLPTVNALLVEGTYYFQVGASAGNRLISNDELAAMSSLTLLTQGELPSPAE